jgi:hypothetical protein
MREYDDNSEASDTILVVDRSRFVVFSTYSSTRVKISRLAQLPPPPYGGSAIHTNEADAIADVNVGWDQLPAVVTADCRTPVALSGYQRNAASIPKVPSSQSTPAPASDRYLLTAAGRYRMRLKSVSGEKAICEVKVQRHGQIVTHFGRVNIPMKTVSTPGAIALQLPAEGLIIAPSIDGITYSLTCSDGRGVDSSIKGAKFVGSVPPNQTCLLAIVAASPMKFETIDVNIIRLPSVPNAPGERK